MSDRVSNEKKRRWPAILIGAFGLLAVGGAAFVFFAERWLWSEIERQALQHGVRLEQCQLRWELRKITLEGCRFRVVDGSSMALPGVALSGSIERIEVQIADYAPARITITGAEALAQGRPRLADAFGGTRGAASLPLEVQASSLSWALEPASAPVLFLRDIRYASDTRSLTAEIDAGPKARGRVVLEAGELAIALGEPSAPRVRLLVRRDPAGSDAKLSAVFTRFPLRDLEGSWLRLPEALAQVEVDGMMSVILPLSLTSRVPSGDVHLTLNGLQFPVPREVAGLVHQSPPRISGAFAMNRGLSELSFKELQLVTGALTMRGSGRLRLEFDATVSFEAELSGALACTALFDSAVAAHSQSPLAQWARGVGRRALSGSVQIASAVSGRTPGLDEARVVTSISPGCGLRPLPIPPELTDLARNLAEELRKGLPGLALPRAR